MRFRIVLLIVLSIILVLLQFRFANNSIVNSKDNYQDSSLIVVKPYVEVDYARAYAQKQAPERLASPEDFALYPSYNKYLESIAQELKDYFYFKVNTNDKIIVLSFDDGPLAYTPNLMELLVETNTPATFFLLCNRINSTNSQWYTNPLFSFGLHTLSHKNYSYFDFDETKEDIDACLDIFKKNNLEAKYFRTAFGIITQDLVEILRANSLEGILWNIDSLDWDDKRGDALVRQVLDNLSTGSIVLFHDGVNRNDLRAIIEGIKQEGYKIVSLEELLEYPRLNLIY